MFILLFNMITSIFNLKFIHPIEMLPIVFHLFYFIPLFFIFPSFSVLSHSLSAVPSHSSALFYIIYLFKDPMDSPWISGTTD